jgi:hypothetical protein
MFCGGRNLMEAGSDHSPAAAAVRSLCTSVHTSTTCITGGGAAGVKHHHAGGVTDEALLHFNDAMSLVEDSEKEAWVLAMERCQASVWEHECCPCYFLVACQLNPWDAAVRMCSYWKERIELFEERAFDPITLGSDLIPPTGFTEEDVKVLETGSLYLLPPDRKGRTIVFVDESRLEPYMFELPKSRLRVFWYLFQCGYTSGDEGAHRAVPLVSVLKPPLNGALSQARWQFAAGTMKFPSCLPIVLDSLHLLTLPSKTGTGRILQAVLSIAASMQTNYVSSRSTVHNGTASTSDSNQDGEDAQAKASLLMQLKALGFTKKGLPQWTGGLFTIDDFRAWVKRRRRIEQKLFWTTEQHAIHKRGVNRIHSRQKRQRRLEDIRDLQDQVKVLKEDNAKARLAHASLEQLLTSAREIVGEFRGEDAMVALSLPPTRVTTGSWSCDTAAAPAPPTGVPLSLNLLASLEPDPIAPSCVASHAAAAASANSFSLVTSEGMHGRDGGKTAAGMEAVFAPSMASSFQELEVSLSPRNSLLEHSMGIQRSVHNQVGYLTAFTTQPANSPWTHSISDHDSFSSTGGTRLQFLLDPDIGYRRQLLEPHQDIVGSSDWMFVSHDPQPPAGVTELNVRQSLSQNETQAAMLSRFATTGSAIRLNAPPPHYASHPSEPRAIQSVRLNISLPNHNQRPAEDRDDGLRDLSM